MNDLALMVYRASYNVIRLGGSPALTVPLWAVLWKGEPGTL